MPPANLGDVIGFNIIGINPNSILLEVSMEEGVEVDLAETGVTLEIRMNFRVVRTKGRNRKILGVGKIFSWEGWTI